MRSLLLSLLTLFGCTAMSNPDNNEPLTIHFKTEVFAPVSAEDSTSLQPDTIIDYHVRVGQVITIIGKEHHSVGSSFRAEYDQEAFEHKDRSTYDNPVKVRMGACGGDRLTRTITLRPLRTGCYPLVLKGNWRGEITNVARYNIIVE